MVARNAKRPPRGRPVTRLGPTLALAALVMAASWAASCGGGASVVVVNIRGAVTGIRQIHVRFSNAGSISDRSYPVTPSSTDIPLPTALSATFAPGRTGLIVAEVTALGQAGAKLGAGTSEGTIVPGGELDLTVVLGGCSGDAACGPADAGADMLSPCPPGANGNVCAPADACHMQGTCMSGTCVRPQLADGTTCGTAPDACHAAPVCTGGVCGAPAPLADGAICNPSSSACINPGKCTGGVCGPQSNNDGAVCNPASDPCHTSGTCSGGTCGPQGTRPEGYQYDSNYTHRCCSGSPVDISTDTRNCGACKIGCAAGFGCISVGGQYQCACSTPSECWSNCCSTSAGAPYVCVPSTCVAPAACTKCPDGVATCTEGSPHYYCHY